MVTPVHIDKRMAPVHPPIFYTCSFLFGVTELQPTQHLQVKAASTLDSSTVHYRKWHHEMTTLATLQHLHLKFSRLLLSKVL